VRPQLSDLTPLVPLSWKARGRIKKRGLRPLLKLLPPSPEGKGVRGMGSISPIYLN